MLKNNKIFVYKVWEVDQGKKLIDIHRAKQK